MTLSRIAPFAGLVLALLALSTWALLRHDSGETAPPLPSETALAALEEQIASLRSELVDARAERLALSQEVGWLRAELDSLDSADPTESLLDDFAITASDPEAPQSAESAEAEPTPQSATKRFDEASLLALGLSASEVARLRESSESSQMEELYLRDQATREGWLNGPRFKQEQNEIARKLRDSMSDDDFDRMLYASGQENRVVLAHVLHGSPAQDAGLRDGDVVLSYDDMRIFKPGQLQRATTRSTSQQTPMLVERNGETLRVFLPAGPLGVQLVKKAMLPYP